MEACNDSDVNRNVLIESAAEHQSGKYWCTFHDCAIYWDVKPDAVLAPIVADGVFVPGGLVQLMDHKGCWRRSSDNALMWPRKTDRSYALLIPDPDAFPIQYFAKLKRAKLATQFDKPLADIVKKCTVVIIREPMAGETETALSAMRERNNSAPSHICFTSERNRTITLETTFGRIARSTGTRKPMLPPSRRPSFRTSHRPPNPPRIRKKADLCRPRPLAA